MTNAVASTIPPIPYTVELASTYRGAGRQVSVAWQEFGPFPDKRAAWAFIQAQGFTAAQKGDAWLAYPA